MAGSTWSWIGTTNDPSLGSNWSLVSGADNANHRPQNGDAMIFQNVTQAPAFLDRSLSNGTVIDLNGGGIVSFANDGSASSGFDATVSINVTGTGNTLQIVGPATNAGRIEIGNGADLAISIGDNGTIQGGLTNAGTIAVDQGGTLAVATSGSAGFADAGAVLVSGSALISGNLVGLANFAITNGGVLELDQSTSGALPAVTFQGTGTLKLDQPGNFGGSINGFQLGDTIDLGSVTISSIVIDGTGRLTAIGTSGTVFTAQTDYGPLDAYGNSGTFALSGTGGAIGSLVISEGSGDTTLSVLQPSTWTWANGVTAPGDTPADWSLTAGPGNAAGTPQTGDSAINTGGTIQLTSDTQFNGNTLYLGGTAGTAAIQVLNNGTGATYQHPSLDGNSILQTAVPRQPNAESSLLSVTGTFVNDGSILANGPAGSVFTLAVTGATLAGTFTPSYFINSSNIEIDTGNAMTILVGSGAELFNVGEIFVNGGSLLINVATDAIAGGYAPALGGIVITAGGTVETNATYAANVGGSRPLYAFADSTAGNTLKIDSVGSFGGAILGFGAGDTIDIGTSLAVGKVVYSSTTGILALENSAGTVLASLVMSSGAFSSGTFTVSGSTAGSFTLGTGTDGNTVLTTDVTNDTYLNNDGIWQSGSGWSGGVPGTLDTVLLGLGASSPFTLTTGSTAVSVGAVVLASDHTSLQITSNTTANAYPLRQFAGTLEVTSGNTLTASNMTQYGGTTTVDAAAVLDLTGHATYGGIGAVNGTITASSGPTEALNVNGTLLVNGGTLNAGTVQPSGSGGRIYIGVNGGETPATVQVKSSGTNAAVVTDTYAVLGSDPTSFGVLTLDGAVSWTDQAINQAGTTGYIIVGSNNTTGNSGTLTPPPITNAATLTIQNGATLTDQSYAQIAASANSGGSVVVQFGGTWNILGGYTAASPGAGLIVGLQGSGALSILGGGTVNVSNKNISVGVSASGRGTLSVSGNNAVLADSAGLNVGVSGQGVAQILNGGVVQMQGTAGVTVGSSAGSTGSLQVSGGNAQLVFATTAKGLTVGGAGSGVVDVESGGTILMNGTGGLTVGQTAGATGLLIVNGPGALINEGSSASGLSVGQASTGTLQVTNGGTISLNGTAAGSGIGIGVSAGVTGSVQVFGANAAIISNGPSSGMSVGQAGHGILTVQSGGTVQIGGNGLGIGVSSGGSGSVTVGGGVVSTFGVGTGPVVSGSALIATQGTAGITVGGSGAGTLTINSGGTVSSGGGVFVGGAATGSGTVDVTAGTLLGSGGLFIGNSGTGAVTVGFGGFASAASMNIGAGAGGSGTLLVNGGIVQDGGFFGVGQSNASGTLMLQSAGSLITGSSTIVTDINATGTGHASATVDASTWTVNGQFIIGDTGAGTLDITNSGLVNAGTHSINIGNQSGGLGTVTVENGGMLIGGQLFIGNVGGAHGTLTIGDMATVSTGTYTLGSASTIIQTGGLLNSAGVIQSSGTYHANGGTLTGNQQNIGDVIIGTGAVWELDGNVTSAGTLGGMFDILSGATLVLNGTVGIGQTVSFDNLGSSTLRLLDAIDFHGTIANFGLGGTLDLVGVQNAVVDGNNLDLFNGGSQVGTIAFAAAPTGLTLTCFVAGTLIQTADGAAPVENLHEGDLVLTAETSRPEPVVWVGRRYVDCRRHPRPEQVWPMRVRAHAFGPGRPARDLYLSPDHAVFINDVLIPVKYLANDTTIVQVPQDEVTYYHIELPQHDLLLAEGLPVESYLDVGDRSNFDNGSGVVALFPNFTNLKWEAEGCAPLVITGSALMEAQAVVERQATALLGAA